MVLYKSIKPTNTAVTVLQIAMGQPGRGKLSSAPLSSLPSLYSSSWTSSARQIIPDERAAWYAPVLQLPLKSNVRASGNASHLVPDRYAVDLLPAGVLRDKAHAPGRCAPLGGTCRHVRAAALAPPVARPAHATVPERLLRGRVKHHPPDPSIPCTFINASTCSTAAAAHILPHPRTRSCCSAGNVSSNHLIHPRVYLHALSEGGRQK